MSNRNNNKNDILYLFLQVFDNTTLIYMNVNITFE